MQIGYLTIFVHDLGAHKKFYKALGLSFVEEQHGKGPVHYSATVNHNMIFEIYPARISDMQRTRESRRMGWVVSDPEEIFGRLAIAGYKPYKTSLGQLCVRDPDGCTIELLAKTP